MVKTGIDIIKIERMKKLVKNPEAFDKVFSVSEKKNMIQTLAGIFALKEAFMKAAQIKVNDWNEIVVKKEKSGKPYLVYDCSLIDFEIESIDCSISHDGEYAVAIVVIQEKI